MSAIAPFSIWLEKTPDSKHFPFLHEHLSADVVVIGGGMCGVMTAIRLAEAGKEVILLEKNHIATGDSAATTGFLTRVADTSIADIGTRYGEAFVSKLFEMSFREQTWLFDLIKASNIDCEFKIADSYFGSYRAGEDAIHKDWYMVRKSDPNAIFVDSKRLKNLPSPFVEAIKFNREGSCNIRALLTGILRNCPKNLKVFEESEVEEIGVQTDGVVVKTAQGVVKCGKVVVVTGLPQPNLPELSTLVKERLTFVMTAKYKKPPVLSSDLFWDTSEVYFYFRLVDETTVLVGGCDRDASETSAAPFAKLENFLHEKIPGEFSLTHTWSGSLFETEDHLPYAFAHPQYGGKVLVGTGFGGNGLVFGTMVSRVLTHLALGQAHPVNSMFSLSRTHVRIKEVDIRKTQKGGAKKFLPVANVAEFTKSSVVCKTVGGIELVLCKADNGYFALKNACSHAGGKLCDGKLEAGSIECPLHGSKFNIKTGAVVSAPAVRPQAVFKVRVSGSTIEVELPTGSSERSDSAHIPIFAGALKNWKFTLIFTLSSLFFWVIQYIYQYFFLVGHDLNVAWVRSLALSGATLISWALLSSIFFRFKPAYSKYWYIRRALGVAGVSFITLHMISVAGLYFHFDLSAEYFSFDPFKNPLVFGSLAYPIFFAMALTSTDWAVSKLGGKNWKNLHRLVYLGYLFAVFHFLTVDKMLVKNLAGFTLIVSAGLVLVGQLYWWQKISKGNGFKGKGFIVGIALITLYILLALRAFVFK
jgi:hypothetical protein